MIVFKSYFKVLKKLLPVVFIYFGIFFAISIAINLSYRNTNNSNFDFEKTNVNIACINNDEDTILINNFIDYLDSIGNLKEIENNENEVLDSLFFRHVDYVIEIPKGFTKDFLSNKDVSFEIKKVPDSTSATLVEVLLNQYMNKASVYSKLGISEEDIVKYVNKDISISTNVDIYKDDGNTTNYINFYFNYLNYILLAIVISVVGMTLASYNRIDLKKRNIVSPINNKSRNRQLFMATFIVTFAIWLVFVISALILYKEEAFTLNGLLIVSNSFIFMLFALSLANFLGNLVSNPETLSAISNVISLGSSFMCGVFVPQQFLGDFVLNIAKILPNYWYVKNNDLIANISSFNRSNLEPIIFGMIFIIVFTIITFVVNGIVSRKRAQREAW
ncbi:MAG: ABC transporter permease [Bacilli bacterium]|nr:ABC transporter permease [Bacilli bacterium]